ncbi:protein SMAX1-like [Iris pallida]|uniref:Protein SMAX1-like n=1 Tax=Iris pallida TaxID=29817 RepID=A0AAX6HRQ0_IRIPA|nr:protein SMAX1-like [Iris pallida]
MAALKRAQAHQRRGCPEQQQSPLLAVKVDLDQLVVSILDDPGVSRVMKEASFSSPAVKATIEHSLAPPLASPSTPAPARLMTPAAPRNLYLNPRLQQQQQQRQQQLDKVDGGSRRKEEVDKVVEIMMRAKRHNPVLVGDTDLNPVMKEVIARIKTIELGCTPQVLSLEEEFASLADRMQIPSKIRELGAGIEGRGGRGLVIDLGDLKWLVEGPKIQQQIISEMGRAAVAEMGSLVKRFVETAGGRVWLVGTAACATYLRCQVYHPTMESQWDLQAVPVAPKSPLPGLFPRLGNTGILSSPAGKNGILSSSVEALALPKGSPPIKQTTIPLRRPSETTTVGTSQRQMLCSLCTESYERELAKLVAKEFEKFFRLEM